MYRKLQVDRTTLGTPQYILYWGSLHDLHDVRDRMYTEGAVVDAIEKRRQFLATDKILLDFWVAGHPMGQRFNCADRFPKMEALVVGTGTLSLLLLMAIVA